MKDGKLVAYMELKSPRDDRLDNLFDNKALPLLKLSPGAS